MPARPPKAPSPRPAPRLYLVTPAIADADTIAESLSAALGAADVAAVLLRLAPAAESALTKRAKALVARVQESGAAAILDGHADLAARCGADGAHLTGLAAFEQMVGSLKPDRIAGIGGLATRHDAMLAAEAGADYVMFGGSDENGRAVAIETVIERVTWWAEVFEIPCVGFADRPETIAPLVAAGADFVALGDWVFADARGAAAAVAAAAGLLAREPVA